MSGAGEAQLINAWCLLLRHQAIFTPSPAGGRGPRKEIQPSAFGREPTPSPLHVLYHLHERISKMSGHPTLIVHRTNTWSHPVNATASPHHFISSLGVSPSPA